MRLFTQTTKASSVQPAIIASQFSPIDTGDGPLMSADQAVFAAVVALAKDMEFIGRGGFLLPDMAELSHYVKMCVPRIVRGDYLDSYFVHPQHCRPFHSLKGKGFEADEAMIDRALEKIRPVYEAIFNDMARRKPNLVKK